MEMGESTDILIKILTGTASPIEKIAFDKWLKESENNPEFFQKAKTVWETYGQLYDDMEFDEMFAMEKIKKKINERKPVLRKYSLRPLFMAAASVILILGTSMFLYIHYQIDTKKLITYQTENYVKEIELSDGSNIWLNRHSKLTAPETFSKKNRKVTLEGEAFFKVKRDISRPFKVKAGETTTKVLGTSFIINYDKESENVDIIVHTGKVAFYKTRKFWRQELLLPTFKGEYKSESQRITKSKNTNPNFNSWKTGTLSFNDVPLKQVCMDLSKHFDKKIITTLENTDIVFTGDFKDKPLDYILEIIKMTTDVKVTKKNNMIMIQK